MKKSEYLYELEFENKIILYSTRSGSLVSISKNNWNNFDSLDLNTIKKLTDRKFLVSEELNEKEEILKENLSYKSNIYHKTIMVSEDCNLACVYCGQDHKKNLLARGLSNKLYSEIRDELIQGSYKELSIAWFGGEPLLNVSEIKYLSSKLKEYCASCNIKFHGAMATNGLLLNQEVYHSLVHDCNIEQFEITLDGLSYEHNKLRRTKNREDGFSLILNNLKSIAMSSQYKKNISIRMNVGEVNLNSVEKLIDYFEAENLIRYFKIEIVPIRNWGNNAGRLKGEILKFNENFMKLFFKVSILMFKHHGFSSILPSRRKNVCVATTNTKKVIDTSGNSYLCSETPIVKNYSKNDVNKLEQGIRNFYNSEYPCQSCKLLPVCGGHCPKLWVENTKACPFYKEYINELVLFEYGVKKGHIKL